MSFTSPDPADPAGRRGRNQLARLLPVVSAATVLGLVVGLIMVGLAGAAGTGHDSASPAANVAAAGHGGAGGHAAGGKSVSYDIELGDMYIKPAAIDVPAGGTVTLRVTNRGNQQHSLALDPGEDAPMIEPGGSTTLTWGPFSASTQAWCTVAGHKDAGMLMKINVSGGEAPAQAAPAGGAGATAEAGGAQIDPAAKPAADWKPFDPLLRPAEDKTVHEATFSVKEGVKEVAPGVKQLLWTYNGSAPGPVMRGRVGDLFRVTLVNDGTMPHSIDFHASKVAPNVQMRTIKPGESLKYEFEAKFAGIFTYHCGTDPMIHHMGNGMFGTVIVDPPDLPKVDKELVMVQSELNLGADGKVMDLKKMMSGQNDAVVFNGYHNQYVHAPIKVEPGERIRVWVDNAAINEDCAFHVVGTIFDTVWKEGAYVLPPGSSTKGGSQTLDLQPTQGGFVEFTLEDAGTYTFVSHKMRNLSRGAAGILQVGDGEAAGSH